MNSTLTIVGGQNAPAAERSPAVSNAGNDGDLPQARFAEVLRGKQADRAYDEAGSRAEKDDSAAGLSAPAEAPGADTGATDPSTTAMAAPAPPAMPADPMIAAMLLDPGRRPAARGAPLDMAGAAAGRPAIGGPASAGADLPDALVSAAAATPPAPLPGTLLSGRENPATAALRAGAAATGVRADPHAAGPASPVLGESPRDANASTKVELPFGMAAHRATTTAPDAARPDAGAWAPFAAAAAAAAPAPAPLPPIEAPVGSPRFVDETAQQVTWLVKNGLSEAEIRVKPADMGPISVRIEMNQNEATLTFAVSQPETRAAVQDSLHRLTEMLADSGISLGQANVGGQDLAQQSRDGANPGRSRVTFIPGRGDEAPAAANAARRAAPGGVRSLVDTFA
jgi:flagellar hook-length control protein FliK